MKTFDLIEYDREDFAEFLYDFLPDDFESINDEIYGEYKNINSGYHLGSCKSLDLDIFEFETNKNLDARVSLTREVCAVMKKYGFNPNALIIFYSNDSDKYRLSLITTDYKSENNKIKAEYSNPRRFSFKLGKDCKRHTPEQMLFTKGPVKSIEDLKSRFSVESISDAFFEQYKVFYEDFVQFITGNRYLKKDNKWIKTPIHKPNKEIYEEFLRISNNDEELAQKYVRDYIKKMMGRLVFLQFLQKKGWLGVEQNELWGTGDKSYLQKLFETTDFKDDFLEKVLEPLFFKTLNQKRDGDIAQKILQLDSKTKVKIPYLNGGLFEEDILDKIKISFPKELFSNTKKRDFQRVFNGKTETQYDYTNAQGLLDFFAQYNFTIDETDPTETELGVDPEMLGKIFENLLEDNKDKGAFYTPKEIVQYMCQESLIAYLSSNTSHCEAQSDEAISFENRIRDFVKNPHNPHYFTEEQKTLILQKLKDVKVCDPAIGSGAFPMGMMNILYACRSELESENDICEIKKQIVKNNIYGVDIEKGAVDIARLRFWLSIIVDETEPIPLPNLDYKLMQGNSLIESFEGVDLSMITKTASEELFDNEETLKKLQAALEGYYIPDNTIAKDKIRNQIKTNVITLMKDRQLAPHAIEKLADENFKLHENSEFFLWHTWFNDVFNRSNNCDAPRHCERSEAIYSGFDIVIGNPPYIKEYENRAAFEKLKAVSPYYMGKMDIWYAFACHGIDLLNKGGHLCFIAQNNWTTSAGAKKLRNKVIEYSKIKQLVDFNTYMVFESASIQTMIMLFEHNSKDDNYKFDLRTLKADSKKEDMLDLLEHKQTNFTQYLEPTIKRTSYKDKLLTFSQNDDLFEKIAKDCVYLQPDEATNGIHPHHDFVNVKIHREHEWTSVGQGIFGLSHEEKQSLNLSEKEELLVKPYYTSEQVGRYYTNPNNDLWIIYTDSSYKNPTKIKAYPNIKNHLDKFKKIITSDNKPYGLHRAREEHFFKGEKIVSLRKCVGRPSFSYSDFDCYVSATFYVIQTNRFNLKYLTGLLNSKLIAYWLKNKGKMQGSNYQIDKEPLMQIPLKNATAEQQEQIASLVDKILAAKKQDISADTSSIEQQIDQLVYKLYELTEDEIAIIEKV